MSGREIVTDLERDFFYSRRLLPKIYTDYLDYSRKIKKLETSTLQNRKTPVLKFILAHPGKNTLSTVKKLSQKEIQDYTMNEAAYLSRELKRNLVVSLRDFFRFLHLYSHTSIDLSKSVPTITTYRMATIPRGMPWENVEAILKSINTKIFSGKRDYAIVLVFARYGVRSCQLRELKLQDIDWKNKTIRFPSKKGGKEIIAPLYDDVAKAILAYLKGGRMKASKKYSQVFLTTGIGGSKKMGQIPLQDSTWNIVSRALKKSS